jgi:hypothetical protein
MDAFAVRSFGSHGATPHPQAGSFQIHGYRAPGSGVLVVEEDRGWVRRADGSREDVAAPTVVMWDAGDWVEYGSDGTFPFRTRDYWAATLPEEESQARLNEIFGPAADR